ncbi:hypothetical protein EV189_0547 [Motilibacter rhizosphaerae]|uniref:Uncharacterized protein n=1 Tax=Motilibacter rhizosphaerae TaxID=598652 RepID=A0A4V2F522_9ACTN|nr:hypothetical protein [Motilibacter rhizosphaerae]RZS91309.1 hypothetical protein EV189_0547 [Motilibacter rhizosphaerae]
MRRCATALVICVAAAGVPAASSAAASGLPPSPCRYDPVQVELPDVARSHSLSPADFAGNWHITSGPPFAGPQLDEAAAAGLQAYSLTIGERLGTAPVWSLDQSLYRFGDAVSAETGYQFLLGQLPCSTSFLHGSTTDTTSPDGATERTVFQATTLPSGLPVGLTENLAREIVVRSGSMVGVFRVETAGSTAEVRAAGAALDAFETASVDRLAGITPPPGAVDFPVDASRRAPATSAVLTAHDLGRGWRRLGSGTFFSGGVDDGAQGGTAKCQPVDFAVVAGRTASYVTAGQDPRKVEASWENISRLQPGQGARYMARVRALVRTSCSRYRFIAGESVPGVRDDALVLGPAYGVKGGRGIILVRRGDEVAALGLAGPVDKRATIAFREHAAQRMAARL